ncbi:TIGR02679 domain-containing protein [Streptomyces sp. NPDC002851]
MERLEKLPKGPSGIVPLPVLAEWATGYTNALVPGAPLEQLVLRVLAQRTGGDVPRERAGRRALWGSAGAIAEDLASQVLVLGIRLKGDKVVCDWLRDAADFGIPFRLTLHQLAYDPVVPAAGDIFVCENPAVLRAAAAELEADSAALVAPRTYRPPPATSCSPTRYAQERLHWRADFDRAGPAHHRRRRETPRGNTMAHDCRRLPEALDQGQDTPLGGPPAPSPWGPKLARAMGESGHAVMEERLLPALLADLTRT